ncbi:transmembrane protein 116 isoform X4 [Phycodurus eques]|uniref:transmembrane protein 116 isoform X4 n=1 Tax=Phycodurus eques TaxID=693459 RepID=UPI002ACD3A17|nr:transmembrane protein 116 isoform X4 [Phycodurus eques]
MEGAFAQHNASGTHDWTRVGSALPWIHVIAALVSALGSASVITRVTSQRVGGATSEVSVRVGAVSRRRRDLCGVVAGASALPAGRIRPAARPLRTARGRDARAPRRRPRLVPPARRATGRVYRVLLLHAQLRVERVRSAASQPLVRPSPAFCAVRDAKWQDDRTAFWRGSASPDGARLHRRKRRRLRRRLRRPLQRRAWWPCARRRHRRTSAARPWSSCTSRRPSRRRRRASSASPRWRARAAHRDGFRRGATPTRRRRCCERRRRARGATELEDRAPPVRRHPRERGKRPARRRKEVCKLAIPLS